MATKPWIPAEPKILVIGHDPRLQDYDTIAEYALFSDYHFMTQSNGGGFASKKGLADSVFNCIHEITNNKFSDDEICVTNLCNNALPPCEKRTVFIPQQEAEEGIKAIQNLLSDNPTIQYIFAMSEQVNYWLQKLGFYPEVKEFIEKAEPDSNCAFKGCYQPKKGGAFLSICGEQYKVNKGTQTIIPILHVKCYPLKGNFAAYQSNYDKIKKYNY